MEPTDQAPGDDWPRKLARVVAAQVPCPRRQAEQYIAEGWVTVDGRKVEEPQFRVTADQRVEIDPRARLQAAAPATLLLHKPAGMAVEAARALVDAGTRWADDRSGIRWSKAHTLGLAALLPLPDPASGLVVFSQDPRVIRKLRDDAHLVELELVADVAGTVVPGGLERLGRGLVREGRAMPPARVSWQSETRLRFATKGIDPVWLPWMCAQVGLELTALRRIRIGRVAMAGLPPGQWRYLLPGERF